MLEALLQAAKARNIARVRLSVDSDNTTAIRLYESHGFIRVDDGDGKLFMDRAEDRK
jgi:ribosomal protein S18 acetylase RimI-like enzyme